MIIEQNVFGGNMEKAKLKINEQFRSLIPPLSDEELSGLTENILKEGCRDPIVTWNGFIIDGHHRYAVCTHHNIYFKTVEVEGLKDDLDVEEWMIKNQIAKRNLTTIQKAEMALKLEDVERRKAKERKISNLKVGAKSPVRQDLAEREQNGKALEKAAKQCGVSYETVRRAKKVLEEAPETLKQEVLNSKVSIDKAFRAVQKQERRKSYQKMEWPKGKFRVILADPPWSYEMKKPGHGDTDDHYDTLSIEQICQLPVRDLVDQECVLFLWVTVPLLEKVFAVLDAWGFSYRTSFVWDKGGKNIGSYSFVNHEYLILATYGTKPLTPEGDKPDSLMRMEKSRKHSEKPEEFRAMIDAMYPNGNRIELFGRKKVEGWQVYGNDEALK